MGELKIVAADSVAPAALHGAFAAAFSDYLPGPFNLPLAQWPAFIGRQAAVLSLGRAAVREHTAHRIAVPQLQRPGLGGEALERLGFERQPLHQLLMRRAFK